MHLWVWKLVSSSLFPQVFEVNILSSFSQLALGRVLGVLIPYPLLWMCSSFSVYLKLISQDYISFLTLMIQLSLWFILYELLASELGGVWVQILLLIYAGWVIWAIHLTSQCCRKLSKTSDFRSLADQLWKRKFPHLL